MSVEILTPFTAGTRALELSGTPRPRYRKQIMKLGTIRYRDRTGQSRLINFDRPYLQSLVEAYNQKAYEQVPFQLADARNGHNNDPERFRGDLVGMELTRDGIDGIFEPTEEGERLLRANPRLGVSCRIIENLSHSDGRSYPRAVQHVLGTVDPQLTGMRPWERVDLSAVTVDQKLDLSEIQEETMPPDGNETVTLELSSERHARLMELLDDLEAADALGDLVELSDSEEEEGENDDIEETVDEPEEDPNPGQVDLSRIEAFQAVRAQADAQQEQILELTRQLRDRDLQHELDRLADSGLAPAIIKAAQPLLAVPSGSIELSSPDGSRTDPAEVVRQVLQTVLDLASSGYAVVDLNTETGYRLPGGDADPAQKRRDDLVDDWEKNYG